MYRAPIICTFADSIGTSPDRLTASEIQDRREVPWRYLHPPLSGNFLILQEEMRQAASACIHEILDAWGDVRRILRERVELADRAFDRGAPERAILWAEYNADYEAAARRQHDMCRAVWAHCYAQQTAAFIEALWIESATVERADADAQVGA